MGLFTSETLDLLRDCFDDEGDFEVWPLREVPNLLDGECLLLDGVAVLFVDIVGLEPELGLATLTTLREEDQDAPELVLIGEVLVVRDLTWFDETIW